MNAQIVPLPGAHAHNDYRHNRPLLDALAHGFTSIEADILLIDGEIYVGHDLPESPHSLPTLKEAYLEPLDSIIQLNQGVLYPGFDQVCYLMIDIKTEALGTYQVLKDQLWPYRSWISGFGDQQNKNGKISIFLSGNRPLDELLEASGGLVSLDGRPNDLGRGIGSEVMPVISQNYNYYSKWKGEGEMPIDDQKRIKTLAHETHQEGKKIRLWATPEGPSAWAMLQSLGVDLINTDDLQGLRDFLLTKQKK